MSGALVASALSATDASSAAGSDRFFAPTPALTESQHLANAVGVGGYNTPPSEVITEEEIYALMQEVEEELQREGERVTMRTQFVGACVPPERSANPPP